jgi:hypothetical protein
MAAEADRRQSNAAYTKIPESRHELHSKGGYGPDGLFGHDAPAEGIHILKTHLCDTGEDEAVSLVSFYRTAPFTPFSLFLLVYYVDLNRKFT